ncbi:unnamed protein product [Cladocopium goreaui]|uniref:Uncharacterized protein n=1 Tax=Cladocopium goreaui TaxID=2562237 RepID=A0A9P1FTX8_9DINO|nr:unnamed protein product [Cladocopium goreaui]
MAWRGGVANWRSCRSPHPVAFRERCSDKNASSCKMAWPDLGRPGSNLILVSYFESKSRHHGMMWMNLSVLWSVAGVCLKYLHLKQPKETRMRPGACGHLRAIDDCDHVTMARNRRFGHPARGFPFGDVPLQHDLVWGGLRSWISTSGVLS